MSLPHSLAQRLRMHLGYQEPVGDTDEYIRVVPSHEQLEPLFQRLLTDGFTQNGFTLGEHFDWQRIYTNPVHQSTAVIIAQQRYCTEQGIDPTEPHAVTTMRIEKLASALGLTRASPTVVALSPEHEGIITSHTDKHQTRS